MKKFVSLSATQARGLVFVILSAILVVCASLAATFLSRTKHVSAEEAEDGAAYDTLHAEGGEEEQEENFFDVYAGYAEEIEAEERVDAEEDDHEHDETEEWCLFKVDTFTKTQSYKLRARLAARGAFAKEDVVKRRRSCGCDGILI